MSEPNTLEPNISEVNLLRENWENPQYWRSRFNNGLAKFYVLKILSNRPSHGYGILKELSQLTEGCCTYTLGTIYPILANLRKHGYAKLVRVPQEGNRERKVFALTPKGEEVYRIASEAWREAVVILNRAINGPPDQAL